MARGEVEALYDKLLWWETEHKVLGIDLVKRRRSLNWKRI